MAAPVAKPLACSISARVRPESSRRSRSCTARCRPGSSEVKSEATEGLVHDAGRSPARRRPRPWRRRRARGWCPGRSRRAPVWSARSVSTRYTTTSGACRSARSTRGRPPERPARPRPTPRTRGSPGPAPTRPRPCERSTSAATQPRSAGFARGSTSLVDTVSSRPPRAAFTTNSTPGRSRNRSPTAHRARSTRPRAEVDREAPPAGRARGQRRVEDVVEAHRRADLARAAAGVCPATAAFQRPHRARRGGRAGAGLAAQAEEGRGQGQDRDERRFGSNPDYAGRAGTTPNATPDPHAIVAAARPPPTPSRAACLWITGLGLLRAAAFLARRAGHRPGGRRAHVGGLGPRVLPSREVGFSPLRFRLIFHPPLYPYFIGVFSAFFGGLTAVKVAQVVRRHAARPALGPLGRRAFGPRAGLAGRRPSPPSIPSSSGSRPISGWRRFSWSFSGRAFERLVAADAAAPLAAAAAAGLLFGVSVLARETALYFLPVAAALAGLAAPGRRRARGRPAARGRSPCRSLDPAQLRRLRRLRARSPPRAP